MAATNGTTTHLTAGPTMSSASITAEEVQEYERILKISEEIFSGSHPRLKVPQKFVRKPKTQSGQASPLPQQVAKNKPAGTEPTARLETSRKTNSTQAFAVEYAPSPASTNTAPDARVPFKPASSIDPIFLTKSDDLVKAELQLQRQRVERTLRDQLEQRKQDGKQKPNIQDIKPEFDVSDVLNKAFDIVKPVSLSDPSEINAADSFDENSYYSSKAPDSPPLAGEHQNLSPVIPTGPSGASTGPPVEHYADELQRLEALNKTGSDQEMPDAYPVADQRISHPQNQLHPNQTEAARRFHEAQEVEIVDEPEYSPPAPAAPPVDHRVYEQVPANSQGKPRYLERPPDTPYYSPGSNVTVVRNHITSPAAPRPSRVSPLATSKVAPIQVRDDRYEPGLGRIDSDPESGRASPSGPAPQVVSRKRRRLQEKGRNARVSYKRQNADHSDTYIKEEPVSPPPFTDDPAVVRTRQPQQQPVYIDIESPRYSPVPGRREPASRAPIYEINPYHEIPAGQLPSRTISRVEARHPVRDETEIRRVTSMQYARQPEYPQEYVEHDPHAGRSASYAVVERRQPEQPRYYEELSSYGPRYIQVNEPSQPAYGSQYYEAPQPARVMPPPPPPQPQRRYVVDEHGNEYEIVPSRRGQTMAPPSRPTSRAHVPQPEIYDDRPVRTASVRAPSVVQDPYVERRYIQEMPPPQPVYRRVTSDYARPVAGERPPYAAPLEAHEPFPRSASVQVAEYLPRRQAYVEEHTIPQERVIRTASVRPQPQQRYEEPHEVVQRVGDTRPAGHGREVSVYMDERSMGDYVERPYYVRERRYFEDENSMALDGNSEQPVHRVSQHY
ncbi:hypothetical protein N7478_002980 [Penicillium angulare]|uniref:uncharacterized protein n=1 Tax=Penicillium angulare TaxID=116970 RepID=UPI0025413C5E|nr:uncharacterized protein N7478_002980 [Penicillium angulare]KAJ5287294.1 hypothetical protein N7478_002980 [Penicillium angulare]